MVSCVDVEDVEDSSYNWIGEAETRVKIRAHGQGFMGEKFKILTEVRQKAGQ